jgi:hypothetical protein
MDISMASMEPIMRKVKSRARMGRKQQRQIANRRVILVVGGGSYKASSCLIEYTAGTDVNTIR